MVRQDSLRSPCSRARRLPPLFPIASHSDPNLAPTSEETIDGGDEEFTMRVYGLDCWIQSLCRDDQSVILGL